MTHARHGNRRVRSMQRYFAIFSSECQSGISSLLRRYGRTSTLSQLLSSHLSKFKSKYEPHDPSGDPGRISIFLISTPRPPAPTRPVAVPKLSVIRDNTFLTRVTGQGDEVTRPLPAPSLVGWGLPARVGRRSRQGPEPPRRRTGWGSGLPQQRTPSLNSVEGSQVFALALALGLPSPNLLLPYQTSRRTKSRGPPCSQRTVRWTSAQKSFQAIFSYSLRTSSQDTP